MAKYVPVYQRRLSPVVALIAVLGVVALAFVINLRDNYRYSQHTANAHLEGAFPELIDRLSERADEEESPTELSTAELVDEHWSCCGFERGDFELTIRGEAPAYSGTTLICNSDRLYRPATCTVRDLSQKDFQIETTTPPAWWELWK